MNRNTICNYNVKMSNNKKGNITLYTYKASIKQPSLLSLNLAFF